MKRFVFTTDTMPLMNKIEGMALMKNQNVLLINDNDFGIDSEKTEIVNIPMNLLD